MSCCRPSACSGAMLATGGYIAAGELIRSSALWMWAAILLVVIALSMFTVTPTSPEHAAGGSP